MATPNGYPSDCGVSTGGHPYYYDSKTNVEDQGDSSHLSFLYDRAQGNSYTQQSPVPAASPLYSLGSHLHNGCIDRPSGDYTENNIGEGLSRATPAPAFPYNGLHSTGNSPSADSSACPTGSYSGNRWANPGYQYQSSQNDGRDGQLTDAQKGPELLNRQMSNLRVSTSNQAGPGSSPAMEVPTQPRPVNLRTDPASLVPPVGSRTIDRQVSASGGQYRTPQASTTIDPRRNYIRQNIPWKDINAARKFSVPILNRPKPLQVTEFSVDDQMTNNIDHRPPQPEVDQSSVRQLLREGDEIGDYEQTSIRYKGRTNPSKVFRQLQSVTGCSDAESIERHQNERKMRRRQKRDEMLAAAADDKDALKDADDVVDISYVGSKIPSRTFRFLQEAIGARDQKAGYAPSPSAYSFQDNNTVSPFEEQPSRSIKVVHLRPQKSLENLIGDF